MASRPASGVMFSACCSRFARHRDRARTAPIQLVQDLFQRTELACPAHEMPGQQPHALLSRTRRRHRSFEATRSRRIPLTSFTETRPADPGGEGRMARERRAESPRSRARGGQGRMARKAQGPAQGDPPMPARAARRQAGLMARYLLHHRHEPDECDVAFASFQGHHPADGEPHP